MSKTENLTLKQLAQIALGGSKLDHLQISLLHAIINSTLKKLGCENEKVVLTGDPAEHLRKLLQKSKSGPNWVFYDQNVQTPKKQYEKLLLLEEKTKMLESQLDNHLAGLPFSLPSDLPCLTKCEVEEENDDTLNALRHNKWFLNSLSFHLTTSLTCRVRTIELNVMKLMNQIEGFKKEWSSAYEKMNVVKELQENLASLRKDIRRNNSDFYTSMIEIQGLMDFEMDNCDIFPLKVELRDMIYKLEQSAKKVVKKIETNRALAGFATIDVEDNVTTYKQMSIKPIVARKSGKTVCKCEEVENEKETPLLERIQNLDLDDIAWRETLRSTTTTVSEYSVESDF